jgi:hypothetical protein
MSGVILFFEVKNLILTTFFYLLSILLKYNTISLLKTK